MQVYFFEYVGEDAFAKLEHLERTLKTHAYVRATKLLKNTQQRDLYLLVVETSEETHIEAPEGSRVWTFVEAKNQ
jgi:hypothetical protein